ncbi:hypothetical protein ACE5IS_06665 [Leptospira wolffii]|uniref:Tic20-like protein n=1 Tax=Leptospira wolffii TaxID=409998 RepID=A0A2M9ZF55_9LEPT|nr:hypothetical protein [Leptospira wolffii]EPG65465.1 hypothetical protein LEP1GSC061_2911 [Leptospira wolffii serovar Khorat str. Khorat-H2]PJZ66967.1 hypothetical protein CH371_02425 [Leptospira wolffii]TGK61938.1 hypothetical protein EHQ32_03570 [Leptospira wolffii]TGK68539.1 hypothetical protein EHQ27_13010 [Leptospira wolffii]TGK74678.1 hypothetical protein EHQ35_10210 [Leptospira wolffii]
MSDQRFNAREFLEETKRVLEGDEYPNLFAAISYIPFVGWILPWFFRKNQEICKFHAIQAIKLNSGFVFLHLVVWFLREFPILSTILKWIHANPVVTDFIDYVAWLALLGYGILGAFQAYQGKLFVLPLFPEIEHEVRKILSKIRGTQG